MEAQSVLCRAIDLASEIHRFQADKAGQPYILHSLRVMQNVDTSGLDEDSTFKLLAAAVLHDVIEDSSDSFAAAKRISNICPDVFKTVVALTRGSDQEYDEYIKILSGYPMARRIKIADLIDNMDPVRNRAIGLNEPPDKYLRAFSYLSDIEAEEVVASF